MKTKSISLITGLQTPEINKQIEHFAKELYARAVKDGTTVGGFHQNSGTSDVTHYFGIYRSACDEFAAKIYQNINPGNQLLLVKAEAEYAKEKDTRLEKEISALDNKNYQDEHWFDTHEIKSTDIRLKWGFNLTGVILVADFFYNAKSLQVIGETTIMTVVIAGGVSLAIFVLSHIAPILYKEADTKRKKWLIATLTIAIASTIFIALSAFRSMYLAAHGTSVSPWLFFTINFFLFAVSVLVSFVLIPRKEKILEFLKYREWNKRINQRKGEIKAKVEQRSVVVDEFFVGTKNKIMLSSHWDSIALRIRKIFQHSVERFKQAYLIARNGGNVDESFSKPVQEPDIPGSGLSYNKLNMKP